MYVVCNAKQLLYDFATYDRINNRLYLSNQLESDQPVKQLLSNQYFAATSFKEILIHELAHQVHWEYTGNLYNSNRKRYTDVSEVKNILDDKLFEYVRKQSKFDIFYVKKTVSANAYDAFLMNNINELVADVIVLGDKVIDVQFKKLVKGVVANVRSNDFTK